LRSFSPVHLEYMRNMGTHASMSVSIVVRGQLWGLISCHDHDARTVPFNTRVAVEHLGHMLSLQIEAKEERAEGEYLAALRRTMGAAARERARRSFDARVQSRQLEELLLSASSPRAD